MMQGGGRFSVCIFLSCDVMTSKALHGTLTKQTRHQKQTLTNSMEANIYQLSSGSAWKKLFSLTTTLDKKAANSLLFFSLFSYLVYAHCLCVSMSHAVR